MVTPYDMPKGSLGRRFGAPMKRSDGSVCILGGINSQRGVEEYHKSNPASPPANILDLPILFSCFTVTQEAPGQHLLVGGRKSPNNPLTGCYVYKEDTKSWSRTTGISPARFRHCAVPVTLDSTRHVLVYGGRSNSAGSFVGLAALEPIVVDGCPCTVRLPSHSLELQ